MIVSAAVVLTALGNSGCNRSDSTAESPAMTDVAEIELQARLDEAIQFTLDRRMKAEQQAAWQIVHGILAFGPKLLIEADGKTVSALDWLAKGGQCAGGKTLTGWVLEPADHGVRAVLEPGSKTGQGHANQWIGYLSLCGLKLDEPLVAAGGTHTFRQVLEQGQWDCFDGMEAGWTLMAAAAFLPLDATWKSKDGKDWSVAKLLQIALDEDLSDAACGGTHCMTGVTLAVNRWKAEGKKQTEPVWEAADKRVQECLAKAREYQQPDGTFSHNFFQRPAAAVEVSDQIHCHGHTFEFVVYALPKERLDEEWVVRAANQMCELLELTRDVPVECGALYHAAHGLLLYREGRFGPMEYLPAETAETTAQAQQ